MQLELHVGGGGPEQRPALTLDMGKRVERKAVLFRNRTISEYLG